MITAVDLIKMVLVYAGYLTVYFVVSKLLRRRFVVGSHARRRRIIVSILCDCVGLLVGTGLLLLLLKLMP